MLGAVKIWYEEEDGEWNRASFPINLTDRWIGTVRKIRKEDVVNKINESFGQP